MDMLIKNIDPIALQRQVRLIKEAVYQDGFWAWTTAADKEDVEAFLDILDDMRYGEFNVI